jgi:hypothetical protein
MYDVNFDIKNYVNGSRGTLPLWRLSHSRYRLGTSSNRSMSINQVTTPALPHSIKWNDNRDCVILEFATV